MSSASLHKVICSKCGREQTIERYDSINDYHRELFPKIIDKTIFDFECEFCKEKIHEPYPLLFHKMGFSDIQIGYKMHPIPLPRFSNPLMEAIKMAMEIDGHEMKDVSECYDDENEFAQRVAGFLDY